MKNLYLCAIVAAATLVLPLQATANPTPEQLIDGLVFIDCPLPGASDTGTFDGFLGEEKSVETSSTLLVAQQGKLRMPAPCRNADVQNIMHIGPTALPALLRHLDDNRPTGLVVGQDMSNETFGGQFFSDEYETRHLAWTSTRCTTDALCEKRRSFDQPYTVKIGDVCFVLIGQIVNRELNAVRYQPTAIVIVNSPIEMPELAKRVLADWAGIDGNGVKKSLLADLHATKLEDVADPDAESQLLEQIHSGALIRLRYYFPDTYAALAGADLVARDAFERAERERGRVHP
jgi:hypothetical protein